MINWITDYGRYLFNIPPQTGNLLSKQISKTKSTKQLDFFANRVIYFGNKLPNQIKGSNRVENFNLMNSEIRKRNQEGNF